MMYPILGIHLLERDWKVKQYNSVLLLKRNDGNWTMTLFTDVNQYLGDVVVKNSVLQNVVKAVHSLSASSY